MEFRFAPGIFAPDSTSANPIKLYDEGYAVVLDTQREAPARWSTSQSDEEGSNDLGRQNALATHGPIVLHPDLPLRTIQQVQLPAFLCVAVSALSGHTAIRNRPGAVSSNCTPVPESFRTVSAADALAEIQGIGRVWPEVVVINIDTPVSKAVTETFRSVETIIDNVAIAN